MYIELLSELNGTKLNIWKEFLANSSLTPDSLINRTVLIWDNDTLVATGSRYESVLKCMAVDEKRQGEGLTATLVTALRNDAFSEGIRHLFLYTKPKNKLIFEDLFFYPVAQTEDVLLMEDKKDGINKFLDGFKENNTSGKTGCIVMNCNPFTLGHLYLAESAAKECDRLYIFVVSEDKSTFSAKDRIEMVKRGTAHIQNAVVLPTGPYLISSATFPTYFLKEKESIAEIKCLLDIEIFARYYAKKFNIAMRFAGTEPLSQSTAQYNEAMRKFLPSHGIDFKEIPRLEKSGAPISASRVRSLIDSKKTKELKDLLPDTTYDFLLCKEIINQEVL